VVRTATALRSTVSLCSAACGRRQNAAITWLELRLPPPAPRLTGVLWTSSLLAIGFLLLFYHET
jgi:hypothetical protein